MLDTLSSLVASLIVGQNSISDSSSFVRSPSLRGLPADEMLVMLDGKRYNRSALVQVFYGGETALAFGSQGPDVGAIPSIAIKSLEILRDGASAQYGSDAIAGVLNYQLRDNSSGIELTSRLGAYRDEYDYSGQLFSAKFITDLDLAYEAMKNVTVGIGGRNIFNVFPDKIATDLYPSTGCRDDGELLTPLTACGLDGATAIGWNINCDSRRSRMFRYYVS